MMAEWECEPAEGFFSASGLCCMILRHPSLKHLCGYVAVPEDHPLFGVDADRIELPEDWYPHGGLTYSERDGPRSSLPGTWVFGFDCAHSGDLVPGAWTDGTYRNWAYVKAETERLAARLAEKEETR